MHKVASTKYTFNDNLTYFIGPNGAGKSTILQALQLGLLGYVPGLPKTAESIFSHANGPVMSVTVELDNDGNDVAITRSWMKNGSSVKCLTNISPTTVSENGIKSCIGDMELPIFDFNEFNSMTSNKLKDWFINFLPKSNLDIDWKLQLESSARNAGVSVKDGFLSEILSTIPNALSGVDQVRAVNEILKEKSSFVKGQLASAESTVQSLIFYDDADMTVNIEEIDSKIRELSDLRLELVKYETSKLSAASSKANAEARIVELNDLMKEDVLDSEHYRKQLEALKTKLNDLSEEVVTARSEWQTAQKYYSELMSQSTSDKCPVLECECSKLEELKEVHRSKVKKAEKDLAASKKKFETINESYNELNNEFAAINTTYNAAVLDEEKHKSAEAELTSLFNIIKSADEMLSSNAPTSKSQDDIVAEINNLTEQGRKYRANEEYNKLIDKFTKDKFERQSELEALKIWVKLTDANGLQTELMNSVFEEFESKLTETLRSMFSDEAVTAKFNLISKANSFSFGIVRGSQYVKYDLLSSGEKCLYMAAMLVTLLKESETSLKLIMIDDLLDHLDDVNADKFFSAAESIKDIQFILAGVKMTDNSEFKVEV